MITYTDNPTKRRMLNKNRKEQYACLGEIRVPFHLWTTSSEDVDSQCTIAGRYQLPLLLAV